MTAFGFKISVEAAASWDQTTIDMFDSEDTENARKHSGGLNIKLTAITKTQKTIQSVNEQILT